MNPTSGFSPTDSRDLSGAIVVHKERVTWAISVLPVVEVGET